MLRAHELGFRPITTPADSPQSNGLAEAFERLLTRAEVARKHELMDNRALTETIESTEKALALYQGHLLANDEVTPWATSLRERLRARALRHLSELGRHRERAGQWDAAVACYEKALEIDDCAEEFYCRLMAAYQRLGRRAEALAVYQRCRQRLAAVLGVEPSPETEALHAALRQGPGACPLARA